MLAVALVPVHIANVFSILTVIQVPETLLASNAIVLPVLS